MRILTSDSHGDEFDARAFRRAVATRAVRDVLRRHAIKGDPFASVPRGKTGTLSQQLARAQLVHEIPSHIYRSCREWCNWLIGNAVLTHEGPL